MYKHPLHFFSTRLDFVDFIKRAANKNEMKQRKSGRKKNMQISLVLTVKN